MLKSDSVSLFAEGTFEEQVRGYNALVFTGNNNDSSQIIKRKIQELVNYLTRGLSDEARAAFIKPFQEVLITRGSQKPLEEDSDRRRQTIIMVLAEVKNLGQGSDRGTLI
jgi:translation initiation factor 3 subunit M